MTKQYFASDFISDYLSKNKFISLDSTKAFEDKTFQELGLDEFDLVDLVMEVEEAFEIMIEEELFSVDSKVSELTKFAEEKSLGRA